MRGVTCNEWQHVKFFGSLIVLWELIDVSLLILLWMMRNFFADVRKGGDFLKSSWAKQYRKQNLFFFFTIDRQRGKVQHLHVQTAYVIVIFKTLGLTRLSHILSHTNKKSGEFQSFQVQTAWQYHSQEGRTWLYEPGWLALPKWLLSGYYMNRASPSKPLFLYE